MLYFVYYLEGFIHVRCLFGSSSTNSWATHFLHLLAPEQLGQDAKGLQRPLPPGHSQSPPGLVLGKMGTWKEWLGTQKLPKLPSFFPLSIIFIHILVFSQSLTSYLTSLGTAMFLQLENWGNRDRHCQSLGLMSQESTNASPKVQCQELSHWNLNII